MKVVVFGGAGFLGSHVADALSEAGHRVTVYDRRVSSYLRPDQVMVSGDILDRAAVAKAVRGVDIVYNFAGIADIAEASRRPFDSVQQNVLGNTIILEACRESGVKRFVFASSLYVYSHAGSFYRSTKQACELLIENYQEIFGLSFTILRYGSLYGPRADESNWVFRILKQAFIDGVIERHGDGEELRDYIHVYDAARLSVDALAKEYCNQHVIITGNQTMKTREFLGVIKEMLSGKVKIRFKKGTYSGHYELTPYTFRPILAKRIQGKAYVDLGQGILDLMTEVYGKYVPHDEHNGIYLANGKI